MSFLHGGTNLLTLRNWLDACDKYANDRNSSQLDTHSTAVKHKRRARRLSFGRGRRIRRSCWIVFRQVERNALVSFSKLSKLSKARRSGIKSSADLSSPQSRLQLNRDISAGAVYRDSTKSVPTTRPVGRSKNRAPDVSPSVHRFSPLSFPSATELAHTGILIDRSIDRSLRILAPDIAMRRHVIENKTGFSPVLLYLRVANRCCVEKGFRSRLIPH